jgi:hypothetical protein
MGMHMVMVAVNADEEGKAHEAAGCQRNSLRHMSRMTIPEHEPKKLNWQFWSGRSLCSITDSKSLPNGSRLGLTLYFVNILVNTKDKQLIRCTFPDVSSYTEMNTVNANDNDTFGCHHDQNPMQRRCPLRFFNAHIYVHTY